MVALTADDLIQLTAALKPVILQSIDEEIARVKQRAAKAKRRAADLSDPRPTDEAGHKYSKGWGRRSGVTVEPIRPTVDELERRVEQLERLKYQKRQADSELAAEIAARVVPAKRAAGEDTSFSVEYKRILGELEASPEAARKKYSKEIDSATERAQYAKRPAAHGRPTVYLTIGERASELAAKRLGGTNAPGFSAERRRIVNAIFERIAAKHESLAGLYRDEEELPAVRELVGNIRQRASDLAYRRCGPGRAFASEYAKALEELRREELQAISDVVLPSSESGEWTRSTLDYGQLS